MLSVDHSDVRHIVRMAPCSASMTALDYMSILDEVLDCVDCENKNATALAYDGATPVLRGLKILSEIESSGNATTAGQKLTGSDCSSVTAAANSHSKDGDESLNVEVIDILNMYQADQAPLQDFAIKLFGTTRVPFELLRSVQTAHSRFSTYILNSYSRFPIFLCGDPAHLLKRERNLVYSSRSRRRFVFVDDGHASYALIGSTFSRFARRTSSRPNLGCQNKSPLERSICAAQLVG